jgi:hypothetical protein
MLLLVGILAAIIQQAPQYQVGSIEGTVTTVGAVPTPLAGAQVRITRSLVGSQFPSETTTDGAGHFTLPDISPGTYLVEVSREGYGYRASIFTLSSSRSLPVTVVAGTRTQVPSIGLTPAGTIRGNVLDRNGKGLAGAGVEFLRLTNSEDGRKVWLIATAVLTDAEGKYERTMLGPGDYYVRTILENSPLRIPVYYPETTEGGAAAPIALAEGGQMTADIRTGSAVPAEVHKISGRVVRPDSEAGKTAFVELVLIRSNPTGPIEGTFRPLATTSMVFLSRTDNRPAGDESRPFELPGVPPGRYDLIANADFEGEEYSSRIEVYVGDGGSERVDLVLHHSVEIKGRVVFEGELSGVRVLANGFQGDGRGQLRPQVGDIKLALNRKDGLPLGVSGPGVVLIDRDGRSFSISDVPEGDYELSVGIESDGRPPGSGHYIADVRLGGRSVFDTGFRVGLDPVDSLEVVVGTQGGSIQGKISGQSPLPAALILVPEAFRRSNSSLYRILYLPRNGEFRMNGIAPGNYKIFAVPYLNETVPYRSPEFIARHESRAVSVTVQKGTTLEGVSAPYLALGR